MRAVAVGQASLGRDAGHTTASTRIDIAGRVHEVWYRVPAPVDATPDADPFLAATLLPSMQEGDRLDVAGRVSPRLLAAASTIQDIYHAWNTNWRKIPIQAKPTETGDVRPARGSACFFTGGIDSFYTLLKHRDEIAALIFVHGFDLPLAETALRGAVVAVMRQVAFAFGKPLIEVETNLREFADGYVSWDYYHGAALASVALLLPAQFSCVYIASTRSYAGLVPWGSHPLLDPLWSTEQTAIVHDGCEAPRVEKVAAVARCDLALRTLRVCWENPAGSYNCGRCEKCLRTMVDLRIAGALDRCSTFAHPLDLRAVSRLPVDRKMAYFEESLRAVEQLGTDADLAKALRRSMAGQPRALSSLGRRAGRRLRRILGSWKRRPR